MKKYKVAYIGWMGVSDELRTMAEKGWELHTIVESESNPKEYMMIFEMDKNAFALMKKNEDAAKKILNDERTGNTLSKNCDEIIDRADAEWQKIKEMLRK